MEIKFDPKNIKVVPIDQVQPNGYNPKDKETPEYEKVKESLRVKGLRLPIVVREYEDKPNFYHIIDGEQRWTAAKDLGFVDVLIYSEGVVTDQEAKELTIWYEQKVPFNELELAKLVVSMQADFPDNLVLPFTDEEMARMQELVKFNWDDYGDDKIDDTLGDKDTGELRTLSVIMSEDQYDVVIKAMDKVKEGTEISDARALELICADYLAS